MIFKSASDRTRLCAALVTLAALAGSAGAGERVALQMAARAPAAVISVTAGSGGTSAMATREIDIELDLSAEVRDPGVRVIGSTLYLKPQGEAAGTTQIELGNQAGERAMFLSGRFSLPIDRTGPLAQNAMMLCATEKSQRVSMSVPVVWRLATGRLDFSALITAGLKPSPEILADAGFYDDRVTDVAETTVRLGVDCPPEAVVAAAKPRTPERAEKAGKVANVVALAAPLAAEAEPLRDRQNSVDDAAAPALEPPLAAPRCDGGMLRATGAGMACLCPGNTLKRARGLGDFVCEERFSRRP